MSDSVQCGASSPSRPASHPSHVSQTSHPLVAGVDTSTSATKVVVVDAVTGETLRFGSAPHPEGTSVDPAAWWRAFLDAARLAGGLDDVSAISVGGQQQGMVLLGADGRPVRRAILWSDVRSAPQAEELTRMLGALDFADAAELGAVEPGDIESDDVIARGRLRWLRAVGSALVPSLIITKLRWVLEHESDNARRTAAVCLPHDWLSWRIAGNDPDAGRFDLHALFTDRSEAAGTGYFDTTANVYRPRLLDMGFGRHDVILPRVLGPREWTLKADPAIAGSKVEGGCLIGPGGGDNAIAALGLDMGVGDVSVSVGTSGVVAAVAERRACDPSGCTNGFADATGRFLPALGMFNSSRILDAGRELLNVDYAAFDELALAARPGAGGVTLIPYFEGERVPPRPDDTARLLGLTLANAHRENIARAFVEGLLCNLNDSLRLIASLGVPVERVLLIGGGSRSEAVRNIAPEVFGLDVALPEPGEYVALGAARQAAWVLSGDARPPRWAVPVERTLKAESHTEIFRRYERLRG
ncbi:FGGY family carbohydrate kinase [Bifidobacterium jacchi]|uniref:Xylulose kinase n=1 Tax=Bifidobacterium jacchi TaxID=2490545 RepID=A0A5N5RDS7_9BIFI|nr:FGGY family carbohydrate kinase [Bifidobacterium jacchi]KAB5605425.1 xylulose kinase [Bifidobacterium jacchi]